MSVKREECREQVIFGIDIGTTFSGVAMSWRQITGEIRQPAVLERLTGQVPGRAKVPSVLLYNRKGVCEKWGTQTEDLSKPDRTRLRDGDLIRCEWFKPHIDPDNQVQHEALSDPARQLPLGKTAYDVWGDYLECLIKAAKDDARNVLVMTTTCMDELSRNGQMIYVIGVPVAWCTPTIQAQLRHQALRIGLISKRTESCLRFCSEPEAAALHSFDRTRHLAKQGDVFSVIDAGGGTVDFTSYEVTRSIPLEIKEYGTTQSKRCLFHGSTFVDTSFRAVFKEKLEQEYPAQISSVHIDQGVAKFIEAKRWFSPTSDVAFWQISQDTTEFDCGGVEVPPSWIEEAFRPHVKAIINVASRIAAADKPKYVFLTGGFGDNAFLKNRLELGAGKTVQVIQPECSASSSGSRAVSLGACLYIIQNPVASRISNDWIGIAYHREAQPWEILDHPDLVYDHLDGTKHLEAFLPIKAKAQIVEEDDFFSHRCNYEYKSRPLKKESRTIKLFRSSQDKAPLYSGDTDLELIGTVRLEVNPKMPSEVVEIRAGVRRYKYHFEVRLYIFDTEIKAQVYSDDGKILGQASFLDLA